MSTMKKIHTRTVEHDGQIGVVGMMSKSDQFASLASLLLLAGWSNDPIPDGRNRWYDMDYDRDVHCHVMYIYF